MRTFAKYCTKLSTFVSSDSASQVGDRLHESSKAWNPINETPSDLSQHRLKYMAARNIRFLITVFLRLPRSICEAIMNRCQGIRLPKLQKDKLRA